MTKFKDAQRVQTSVLSAAEKKTLVWLAHRTPRAINSDHLTGLGLFAMLGTGLSYWLAGSHPALGLTLATLFLAMNWLGDSLDGTLARVRNQLRPRYGFYVDHVVDMLGALCLFGGLALSGFMSVTVATGLVIAFLMLSINCYLATYTLGTFQISFGGFSPTELRILLAIGNVFLYWKPYTRFLDQDVLLFDLGGVIAIGGMTVLLFASIARNARQLYREEPIA